MGIENAQYKYGVRRDSKMVVLMFWEILFTWLAGVIMFKTIALYNYEYYPKHKYEILYSIVHSSMKLFSLLVFATLVKITIG